jgi:hypothetical protein
VAAAQRMPVLSHADSMAMVTAWAAADTGRMMPGYHDVSSYDTPGMCAAAMRGLLAETYRRSERSFVTPGSASDTLPTAVTTLGRRCLANLPRADAISAMELHNYMVLAVMLRDTTLMNAVVARLSSIATTDEERGYAYADAISELTHLQYLPDGSPTIPVPYLRHLMTKLDALGIGAHVPRLIAHRVVRDFAERQQFDTTAVMREDGAMRRLALLWTAEDKHWSRDYTETFRDSLTLLWTRSPANFVKAVDGVLVREGTALRALGGTAFTPEVLQLLNEHAVMLAEERGKTAPALTGDYWFSLDTGRVKPALGKITLVLYWEKGKGIQGGAMLAPIKRLYDRYAKDGFDVVLVIPTQGYSWASGPLEPAAEAKTIEWYYRDYLDLPFTIVVQTSQFTVRSDGRKIAQPIPFLRQYPERKALIGRDGKFITTAFGLDSESQLDVLIAAEIARGK